MYDDGYLQADVNIFYLMKLKDSLIVFAAVILSPRGAGFNIIEEIDKTGNSNSVELKNILKTIELK